MKIIQSICSQCRFWACVVLALSVSMPALADNQNSAILPPSLRPKANVAVESPASSQHDKNYRLYQEWKNSKGQHDVEYEEFLLWQDFMKTQQH